VIKKGKSSRTQGVRKSTHMGRKKTSGGIEITFCTRVDVRDGVECTKLGVDRLTGSGVGLGGVKFPHSAWA